MAKAGAYTPGQNSSIFSNWNTHIINNTNIIYNNNITNNTNITYNTNTTYNKITIIFLYANYNIVTLLNSTNKMVLTLIIMTLKVPNNSK